MEEALRTERWEDYWRKILTLPTHVANIFKVLVHSEVCNKQNRVCNQLYSGNKNFCNSIYSEGILEKSNWYGNFSIRSIVSEECVNRTTEA